MSGNVVLYTFERHGLLMWVSFDVGLPFLTFLKRPLQGLLNENSEGESCVE